MSWNRVALLAGFTVFLCGPPALFVSALPAAASCVAPVPVAEALATQPVAFVGSVQSVSNAARVAEVHVESVWVGPDIHENVTVDGRLSATGITSVDRSFEVGARLLFMPQGTASPFHDSSCSGTVQLTPEVAALKPTGARAPLPGGDLVIAGYTAESLPWVPVGAVVVALIGAAVGIAWSRRRRRT